MKKLLDTLTQIQEAKSFAGSPYHRKSPRPVYETEPNQPTEPIVEVEDDYVDEYETSVIDVGDYVTDKWETSGVVYQVDHCDTDQCHISDAQGFSWPIATSRLVVVTDPDNIKHYFDDYEGDIEEAALADSVECEDELDEGKLDDLADRIRAAADEDWWGEYAAAESESPVRTVRGTSYGAGDEEEDIEEGLVYRGIGGRKEWDNDEHEPTVENYAIVIDGKKWKVVSSKAAANKIVATLVLRGKNAHVLPVGLPVTGAESAPTQTNFAIYINGRKWKVVANKTTADKIVTTLQAKGKNAQVHPVNEPVTEGKMVEDDEPYGYRSQALDDEEEENDLISKDLRLSNKKDATVEEMAESIQAAFEDFVKNQSAPEEKIRIKITYNDGHSQTKLVTEKEKTRYESSNAVDKVEVVDGGSTRIDDGIDGSKERIRVYYADGSSQIKLVSAIRKAQFEKAQHENSSNITKVEVVDDGIAEASENRALWDKINRKGVVPSIDRERYTDLSHEGLEGPFRMKSGRVVYYDPKAGKYYDRDTDMYLSHEEADDMNRGGVTEAEGRAPVRNDKATQKEQLPVSEDASVGVMMPYAMDLLHLLTPRSQDEAISFVNMLKTKYGHEFATKVFDLVKSMKPAATVDEDVPAPATATTTPGQTQPADPTKPGAPQPAGASPTQSTPATTATTTQPQPAQPATPVQPAKPMTVADQMKGLMQAMAKDPNAAKQMSSKLDSLLK